MATLESEQAAHDTQGTNGASLAAFVAAGIGAFAMGLIVLLNEAGVLVAPTVYAPAGGVSGRTSIAVVVWLMSWVVLHIRWNGRQVESGAVHAVTLVLIGLGILGTFPPLWAIL